MDENNISPLDTSNKIRSCVNATFKQWWLLQHAEIHLGP